MMKTFLGVSNEVSGKKIPIIPNSVDDPEFSVAENSFAPTKPHVLLQCEDFGGNLTAPLYLGDRPSIDYYASNLSLHMFVIANASENINNVFMYDERAAGKGANEMCSLRFVYHLRRWIANGRTKKHNTLVMVMDNCVGQNKSHACMMFGCLLSLLFYDKVVFFFLPSGHSHMQADRVVAWVKAALKKHVGVGHNGNLFIPEQYIDLMNTVNSVQAEFLDHNSSSVYFYEGWDGVLQNNFKPIPRDILITKFYFFEFSSGSVLMKDNCESASYRTWDFVNVVDIPTVRASVVRSIFGCKTMHDCTVSDIILPRAPLRILTAAKQMSFDKKLPTIPQQYRYYYTTTNNIIDATTAPPSVVAATPVNKTAKKISSSEKKLIEARKSKSILNFFMPVKKTTSDVDTPYSCEAVPSIPLQTLPVTPLLTLPQTYLLTVPLPRTSLLTLPPTPQQNSMWSFHNSSITPLAVAPLQLKQPSSLLHNGAYCGFKWANNSCALDTLGTLLLHLFDSSTALEQSMFRSDCPYLANLFADISTSIPYSWCTAKESLISTGYNSVFLRGRFGDFVSIVAVQESFEEQCINRDNSHISEYLIQQVKLLYVCHKSTYCPRRALLKKFGRDWQLRGCNNFQQCINKFMTPFVDEQRTCITRWCDSYGVYCTREYKFENSPRIIFHLSDELIEEDFVLEDVVNFKGNAYKLFGAIYQKGQTYDHYICRFRRDNIVYIYDGMKNMLETCSQCTPLTNDEVNNFPVRIPHKSNGIGPIRMLGFIFKML